MVRCKKGEEKAGDEPRLLDVKRQATSRQNKIGQHVLVDHILIPMYTWKHDEDDFRRAPSQLASSWRVMKGEKIYVQGRSNSAQGRRQLHCKVKKITTTTATTGVLHGDTKYQLSKKSEPLLWAESQWTMAVVVVGNGWLLRSDWLQQSTRYSNWKKVLFTLTRWCVATSIATTASCYHPI